MGGNFTAKGQQNCSKGIYVLAGIYLILYLYNVLVIYVLYTIKIILY